MAYAVLISVVVVCGVVPVAASGPVFFTGAHPHYEETSCYGTSTAVAHTVVQTIIQTILPAII